MTAQSLADAIPATADTPHGPCDPETSSGRSGDPVSNAVALYHRGRYREALHLASAALRLEPRNAALWRAGAAAAFALGQVGDAEQFWNVALAHDPGCAEAHSNLGALHAERGDLAGAERHLRRAVLLAPEHAGALGNLGAVLEELGRHEEALGTLERSLAVGGESPEVLNNLALALISLGRLDEARARLQRALALKPDSVEAMASLSRLHLENGDEAAALREFEAVLSLDPANAKAHLFKAEQARAAPGAWLDQLQGAYRRRVGRPLRERIQLDFAMGKAWEDLERYDEAFEAYAEGNRLHHAHHPVDEQAAERQLAVTMRAFDPGQAPAVMQPPAVDSSGRVPIFIVGMPRSGTTLAEQILASHPEITGAGELTLLRELIAPPFPRLPPPGQVPSWLAQLRQAGERYLDSVWRSHGRTTFVVDKMPGNYLHLGLIGLMIPQARIIHIRRDPLDTCFSCFALHFATGHEYAYEQEVLGRHYVRYRRLMEHWRRVLPPPTLLEVDYERLVADMAGETGRILDFLGLHMHEGCTRFHENRRQVRTASRTQVRQPIYSRSVGRARRFEKHLTPLQQALSVLTSASVT